MSFTNLSVSKKIISTLGFVIITFSIVTLLVFNNLATVKQFALQRAQSVAFFSHVDDMAKNMFDLSGQVRGYMLTRDEDFAKGVAADYVTVTKLLGVLKSSVQSSAQKQGVELMNVAIDGYMSEAGNPEIKFARDPNTLNQALSIMNSGANKKWMNAFKAAAHDFQEKESAVQAAAATASDSAIRFSEITLLGGAAAALIIAGAMAWLLTRQIARPVVLMTDAMRRLASGDNAVVVPAIGRKDEVGAMAGAVQVFKEAAIEKVVLQQQAETDRQAVEAERRRSEAEREATEAQQALVVDSLASALARMSTGDLTCDMTEAFAPEYERLRTDFNAAVAELRKVIGTIVDNTGAIRSGTGEISQAADDLSRRTEQQAASLEETAAALDQITATVRKTAEGALAAQEIAASAKTKAEHGDAVVGDAVVAMTEIEKSAKEISQIIGVIDEIAFQTNLLALNAGVEAARAGDAGRGFAVVASEVRALAQRSAQAAKEIKALISASTSHVGRGVTLVKETGSALQTILSQVVQINGAVTEIVASAQEQASALAQVNTAINQMDQVTQQNAAMVEESTAASHSLAHDTAELEKLTARFKIGAGQAHGEVVSQQPTRAAGKSVAPMKKLRVVAANTARKPVESQDTWQEF